MTPKQTSDERLFLAAQQGDKASAALLVDRYYSKIVRFCRTMLRENDLAQDAAQDCFFRFARYLGTGRSGEELKSFSSWIYRIAMNVCIDSLKKRKRYIALENEEMMPELLENKPEPAEILEDREDLALVEKAITRLPSKYQMLLNYRLQLGASVSELAGIFDISEALVRVWFNRALEMLRVLVRKDRMLENS